MSFNKVFYEDEVRNAHDLITEMMSEGYKVYSFKVKLSRTEVLEGSTTFYYEYHLLMLKDQ